MSLSDKREERKSPGGLKLGYYWDEDVKQSIKDLKRNLRGCDNEPTGVWEYSSIIKEIDEIFGPKLLETDERSNN